MPWAANINARHAVAGIEVLGRAWREAFERNDARERAACAYAEVILWEALDAARMVIAKECAPWFDDSAFQ